jgi:hypothetical protein
VTLFCNKPNDRCTLRFFRWNWLGRLLYKLREKDSCRGNPDFFPYPGLTSAIFFKVLDLLIPFVLRDINIGLRKIQEHDFVMEIIFKAFDDEWFLVSFIQRSGSFEDLIDVIR